MTIVLGVVALLVVPVLLTHASELAEAVRVYVLGRERKG